MHNYTIKIKPIDLDDIIRFDKEKYNSNNHWVNGLAPSNYSEVLSKSHTDKWIGLFKLDYKLITIENPKHINWLKQANKVCGITGKFSKLFADELEQIVGDLALSDNKVANELVSGTKEKYFVRVNNVSLKYGTHGIGPYSNLRNIIESAVSSIGTHSPINDNTTKLLIYLMDWVDIEDLNEFRIFVYKNKITAISQQNLYNKVGLEKLSREELNAKIDIIINYFYSTICKKITWMSNYTYDFAIINGSEPYFIEANSFGKEYAAGSALFHWELDESILYNDLNSSIEFRYTM